MNVKANIPDTKQQIHEVSEAPNQRYPKILDIFTKYTIGNEWTIVDGEIGGEFSKCFL